MFSWAGVLFLVGAILLVIELFIPGFGVFGISGLACIFVSALIVAETYGPLAVVCILVLIVVISFFLYKIMKKKKVYQKLVLDEVLDTKDFDESLLSDLMGKEGVTVVPLKPYGKAEFDGRVIDVFSDGEYISKGKLVRVILVSGKSVTVKEI